MSKVLPKPQMRNMYARKIKIHLAGAIITSLLGGLAMKVFYADPKKKAYEDFYKRYDPVEHERIMKEAGLLQAYPQ